MGDVYARDTNWSAQNKLIAPSALQFARHVLGLDYCCDNEAQLYQLFQRRRGARCRRFLFFEKRRQRCFPEGEDLLGLDDACHPAELRWLLGIWSRRHFRGGRQ
jgi:hypothetical protein